MRVLAAFAISIFILAGCQGQPSETSAPSVVEASDAWCRPTPNGARTGACYVTLSASVDDRLVSASLPGVPSVQIHEMIMADGMMRMHEMEGGLVLPQGVAVELKPGAAHLMLMGLEAPLMEGAVTSLTLGFEKAAPITVEAAIRQPAAA